LDSIRHSVVIHNGACSPLPCANSIGGISLAPGAASGVCAKAENPKLLAVKGKIPAPCNSLRRDSRIFIISPLVFRILASGCDR
jgi:hypothetical protein